MDEYKKQNDEDWLNIIKNKSQELFTQGAFKDHKDTMGEENVLKKDIRSELNVLKNAKSLRETNTLDALNSVLAYIDFGGFSLSHKTKRCVESLRVARHYVYSTFSDCKTNKVKSIKQEKKFLYDSTLTQKIKIGYDTLCEAVHTDCPKGIRAGQHIVNLFFPDEVKCAELFYCEDEKVWEVIPKYIDFSCCKEELCQIVVLNDSETWSDLEGSVLITMYESEYIRLQEKGLDIKDLDTTKITKWSKISTL